LAFLPVSGAPSRDGLLAFSVAGERAFIGGSNGFGVLDISDPRRPVVLRNPVEGAAVHAIIWDGAETILGITSDRNAPSRLSVFESDPATGEGFLSSLQLPGEPRAVAVANGLAYLASNTNG